VLIQFSFFFFYFFIFFWTTLTRATCAQGSAPKSALFRAPRPSPYEKKRSYQNLKKNYGVEVHIGRYHNILGVETSWNNGKEKAPAAICRKVAQAHDGGSIDVWGDGSQTRSFLYIDECLDATIKIMASDFAGPANIGSEESVSITELAKKVIAISGKNISINYVDGPIGVNGRNSDNRLIKEKLGWTHTQSLDDGLKKLYDWIVQQNNAVN
jgi:nucleoside-diphosphate-sugar epimerase